MAMHLAADMNPHVFGIGITDASSLSGFHSVAVLIDKQKARAARGPAAHSSELLPAVISEANLHATSGCYTCLWNFSGNANQFAKFSSMFPKDFKRQEVLSAILEAVRYWESPPKGGAGTTTGRKAAMEGLVSKYGVHWAGLCKINGVKVAVGGFNKGDEVCTAFPLRGANANF
jgi:hypothetical protein